VCLEGLVDVHAWSSQNPLPLSLHVGSDKTGTLTMNKMMIQEECPVYLDGETQYSLLRYAAMAAKWKEPPRDALDTLTLNAVDMPSMDAVEQLDYMPFDPVVKVSAHLTPSLAPSPLWYAC